ncbi:MAG TPA: SDR family oxidoreductase [Nocardioidaceae bacterium]|nr:SDR family oxidoreductase [Nocardioidaceae bacterium]
MSALTGKVVAITGGARGIGYETAAMLIRHGAKVAIGDIDEARLKEAASELGVTTYTRLDVTDSESFGEFLDLVEAQLGNVDVLINNAGIMPIGRFVEQSEASVNRMVEINVFGVMNGTRQALQRMLPRKAGHIINIASLAGEGAFPGAAAYCGSKFAVVGFTEAIRLEHLGTGVDVSVVSPTFTNTELVAGTTGVKGFRNAEPSEIAEAICKVIEKPVPIRRVTRAAGATVLVGKLMPRKFVGWSTAKFGADKAFLDEVDQDARAAYEERITHD